MKVLAYTTALSQYTVVVKALRGRCRQREGNVLVDGTGHLLVGVSLSSLKGSESDVADVSARPRFHS